MIFPPKLYTKNSVAGYLINDIKFKKELFLSKKAYAINSVLSENNKVYSIVTNN